MTTRPMVVAPTPTTNRPARFISESARSQLAVGLPRRPPFPSVGQRHPTAAPPPQPSRRPPPSVATHPCAESRTPLDRTA
jgi:hypothetical protein